MIPASYAGHGEMGRGQRHIYGRRLLLTLGFGFIKTSQLLYPQSKRGNGRYLRDLYREASCIRMDTWRPLAYYIGVGFGVARSYCGGQCEGLDKRERATKLFPTLSF